MAYFKAGLLFCMGLIICSMSAKAADETEEISKVISEIYGLPMQTESFLVKENNGWKLKLPAQEVSYDVLQKDGTVSKQTERIPEATVKITRSDDFEGLPSYRLFSNSTALLPSMLYKYFLLTGVEVEKFQSETYLIPSIKFVSAQNTLADGFSYSRYNSETGLKEKILQIGSFRLNSAMENLKNVKLNSEWKATDISFNNPWLNIVIPKATYESEDVYANTKAATANLQIEDDWKDFLYSKIRLTLSDMQISIPLLQQQMRSNIKNVLGLKYDAPTDSFQIKGKFALSDISVAQVQDVPSRIEYKYELLNFNRKSLKYIQKMQQDVLQEKDKTVVAEDMMKQLNASLEGLTFKQQLKVAFAQGEVKVTAILQKKGNYMVGNGKIILTDFDKIAPDYAAMCESDMKKTDAYKTGVVPESCNKIGFLSMLRPYINAKNRITGKDGHTTDTIELLFAPTGIFANGQKISDGISLEQHLG